MGSRTRLIAQLHNVLNIGVVLAVTYFIHLELLPLALLVALSSKWRMLSRNPYRVIRSLRANACDLIVIISTVLLMDLYSAPRATLVPVAVLVVSLLIWLLVVKPLEAPRAALAQALYCQTIGLAALWLYGVSTHELPGIATVAASAVIGAVSARHALQFYDGLPEFDVRSTVSFVWGVVLAQIGWLAWMWSVAYRLHTQIIIPQIVLLAGVLGYFAWQTVCQNYKATKAQRRQMALKQALYFGILASAILVLTPWMDI
jgi:hypothetical protein